MLQNSDFWDQLTIQSYKSILKNKPNCPIAHNHLGLAYVRVKKFNKAIRSFERAIKQDKTLIDIYYHMACTYQKMGKRALAIKFFSKYKKICDKKNVPSVVEELLDKLDHH